MIDAEFQNGYDFDADKPIRSLGELASYIIERATAPPITVDEILAAKRLNVYDPVELPEDILTFTPNEAAYLCKIISYVQEDFDSRGGFIRISFDDEDPEGCLVSFDFPDCLEPPFELR